MHREVTPFLLQKKYFSHLLYLHEQQKYIPVKMPDVSSNRISSNTIAYLFVCLFGVWFLTDGYMHQNTKFWTVQERNYSLKHLFGPERQFSITFLIPRHPFLL